jgi:hypothetical protein
MWAHENAPTPKLGRPPKHADRAAKDRAYRERKRVRVEKRVDETPEYAAPQPVLGIQAPPGSVPLRVETRVETPSRDQVLYRAAMDQLRQGLEEAGMGHFDADADIEPMRALVVQGCDLELDIAPVLRGVAEARPPSASPLRNWGAPWLARDILAARDRRLGRVEAIATVDIPAQQDLPRPLKRWDGPVAAAMIRGYRLSIRGISLVRGLSPRTINNQGKQTVDKRHYRWSNAAEKDGCFADLREAGEALVARRQDFPDEPRGVPTL